MPPIGHSARTLLRAFRCLFDSGLAAIKGIGTTFTPVGDDPAFVLYSIIPWDGVWQRPQHFAVRLARHHPVIYVDPVGIQHTDSGSQTPEIRRIDRNLHVLQPRVLPGGKTRSLISRLNDPIILDRIVNLVKDLNLPRPTLITNSPFADHLACSSIWRGVVYDIIDDFIATSWAPTDAAVREKRLFERVDTVFTGTHSLLMKKQGLHPDIEYIPCGVETEHFSKANRDETPLPADIQSIPRPILGYFGALNERIDAELLVRVAHDLPNASIVLIGPIMADFGLSDFEHRWASVFNTVDQPGFRLKPIPSNIHILGIRPYSVLPSYLKAFDVCLMPYVVNQVTKDIHPVKILEYLVSGRPVISTAIPDVERFYTGLADIAKSHSEFCALIRKNLETGDLDHAAKRISFAESKSWDDMADRMRNKVLQVLSQ